MRPVNLLPARYRPRAAGADSKTAYIALGVLAALMLAVFGYVMTARKVSSTNAEIAQTQQRIASAQAQAVTLKGFGDFAAVKQARLTAVRSLATARLDWERLFRELAHVLPDGVWLTAFDGKAAADSEDGGGKLEGEGQGITLKGCANSHRRIADVMVRLRELHVADEVQLTKTSVDTEKDAAPPLPGAPPAEESEEGCGSDYAFDVVVKVSPPTAVPAADDAAPVPARLGGGG